MCLCVQLRSYTIRTGNGIIAIHKCGTVCTKYYVGISSLPNCVVQYFVIAHANKQNVHIVHIPIYVNIGGNVHSLHYLFDFRGWNIIDTYFLCCGTRYVNDM